MIRTPAADHRPRFYLRQQPCVDRRKRLFFERDKRLYYVTSRHVVIDEPSQHHPNRIEIELHTDAGNLTRSVALSVLLYQDGKSIWRQGRDAGGEIDVAVIELDRSALPPSIELRCFTPAHLQSSMQEVDVGNSLLIVGFPLGFHDTLHHVPVVRHAIIASSFGLRFQGQGYFLTDARTHRGTSGAPVVMPCAGDDSALRWKLLGVHSSRIDMDGRDLQLDESLGLNCAWYADILMTLTQADASDDGTPRSPPAEDATEATQAAVTAGVQAGNEASAPATNDAAPQAG
jgi:hypothetical protein